MPTLLELLQQRFPASSTTTLRKMLKSDRVTVNGITTRDAKALVSGDDVVESGNSTRRNRIDSRLRILFEDSDLIVVEKPTELLTVASPTEKRNTVEALLDSYFNAAPGEHRVHVVQRLDRDTSGVLVFARNAFSRAILEEQFAAHDVGRTYVAIVRGNLQPPAGTFRSFLAEDSEMRVRSIADIAKGKEAITHYKTVANGGQYSLLEIKLETGRRNQIRVHLSEAGHPVAGDTMYGGHEDARALNRLALHARDLTFIHPRTKEEIKFTSPLPEVLASFKL